MIDAPTPQPADPDRYVITSATGVDVVVMLAGTGSRSYAFVIDWHIRLLTALAWFLCAALLINGQLSLRGQTPSKTYMFAAVVPALVIYFLYHPILEIAMRGRTPGKRMAGVRLIARSGGAPSAGALLMRNVFRLIDCMPAFYLVGLIATFISSQHLRIGDLAAGTLLVYDQDRNVKSLTQLGALAAHSQLDAAALDLVNDVLARWSELGEGNRRAIAGSLLRRLDARLAEPELAGLGEEALKSRLLALLKSGAPGT
jgi:uncharacterized RDD family membrane protein YckC